MRLQIVNIDGKPYMDINSQNFSLSNALSMHKALNELRLLNTGLEIKFENFAQFSQLINKINNFALK